jgi:hypothetical protein
MSAKTKRTQEFHMAHSFLLLGTKVCFRGGMRGYKRGVGLLPVIYRVSSLLFSAGEKENINILGNLRHFFS